MSLAVAMLTDPAEIRFPQPAHDTDLAIGDTATLALEAGRRGHALYHHRPEDLSFRHGRLFARVRRLEMRGGAYDGPRLEPPERIDLATMDIVLMVREPSFDAIASRQAAYVAATHLLEHVRPGTLVVNDPRQVRNAPERLFVTHFPDLMPPTLITSDPEEVAAFRAEYRDIVLKPLFGCGGAGFFHVKRDDENLETLLEMLTRFRREPVIVQKYLPEIRHGDKRIILIDGEPAGAIARIPRRGVARTDFRAGAHARKTTLTDRDRDICGAIGMTLKRNELIFVGIDVVGDHVTEITVTAPTGLVDINRLDGVRLEERLWDAIETRHRDRHRGTVPA